MLFRPFSKHWKNKHKNNISTFWIHTNDWIHSNSFKSIRAPQNNVSTEHNAKTNVEPYVDFENDLEPYLDLEIDLGTDLETDLGPYLDFETDIQIRLGDITNRNGMNYVNESVSVM